MKIKITEKGAFNQKGEEVKVGEIISINGDVLPAVYRNKCEVLKGEPKAKTTVTNPKKAS